MQTFHRNNIHVSSVMYGIFQVKIWITMAEKARQNVNIYPEDSSEEKQGLGTHSSSPYEHNVSMEGPDREGLTIS